MGVISEKETSLGLAKTPHRFRFSFVVSTEKTLIEGRTARTNTFVHYDCLEPTCVPLAGIAQSG